MSVCKNILEQDICNFDTWTYVPKGYPSPGCETHLWCTADSGFCKLGVCCTFFSVSSFCSGADVTLSEPLGMSSTVALNWATSSPFCIRHAL